MFYKVVRTTSNYYPTQHIGVLVGFYNRDGTCLLSGTNRIFYIRSNYSQSLERSDHTFCYTVYWSVTFPTTNTNLSLNSINWLVFVTGTQGFYCDIGTPLVCIIYTKVKGLRELVMLQSAITMKHLAAMCRQSNLSMYMLNEIFRFTYLRTSNAEFKNEWCYISRPPICLHGVHVDNCTFTLHAATAHTFRGNDARKCNKSCTCVGSALEIV